MCGATVFILFCLHLASYISSQSFKICLEFLFICYAPWCKQTLEWAITEKTQNGELWILLWKLPWNFSFFYFTPGKSIQNKAQPLDIFSYSPLEIPLRFYLTPKNSTWYFFDTAGNSISSTLMFGFFLE